MTRGGKILLLSGCLAATGCATERTVQVRPLADPNGKLHYSGGLLAEARGQLAMGAVGLAIESFRTLQREQPDNVEAYAGLAASYAAMGRYDLTRTNYELALAYAPNDPALLQALASTLDRLGENEQAAQVRSEVRMAAARAAASRPAQVSSITPLGVPKATSMTVKVPQASPPPVVAQSDTVRIAAPTLGPAKVQLASSSLSTMKKPSLVVHADFAMPPSEVPAKALTLAQGPDLRPASPLLLPTASVSMGAASASRLPQRAIATNVAVSVAEPAERAPLVAAKAEAPAQSPKRVVVANQADPAPQSGPYLERTSLGEVALITVARPVQQARLQPRPPQLPRLAFVAPQPADRPPAPPMPKPLLTAAALRWVPLKYASRPQNIALLNAARTDGLAARTRAALVDRGWRKIAIGNARAIRKHSLVLYAPGRWHVAARLAAQFRCKAVKVGSMKNVIVLLGRDALRRGAAARA